MKELYENIYETKFSFGKNWKTYLKKLTPKRIELAKKSLVAFTQQITFKNKTFIDIGCGSGLFSLAAYLLGASVTSVDVDENSLNCARFLREKYKVRNDWKIEKASALDEEKLKSLGQFDIVYSWGVLHHTGSMWKALANVVPLVKEDGLLYIAIYNDFAGLPFSSKAWTRIKRRYAGSGPLLRSIMKGLYICMLIAGITLSGRNPLRYIREYEKNSARGMDFFSDAEDWLGGYPYEYASVKQIDEFYEGKGFKRANLKATKREGCNEMLYRKLPDAFKI